MSNQQEAVLHLELFGLVTIVVFTLTSTRSGTLVRMEQSGFRADQNENYQGAEYGWRKFVGLLEKVVGGL